MHGIAEKETSRTSKEEELSMFSNYQSWKTVV